MELTEQDKRDLAIVLAVQYLAHPLTTPTVQLTIAALERARKEIEVFTDMKENYDNQTMD